MSGRTRAWKNSIGPGMACGPDGLTRSSACGALFCSDCKQLYISNSDDSGRSLPSLGLRYWWEGEGSQMLSRQVLLWGILVSGQGTAGEAVLDKDPDISLCCSLRVSRGGREGWCGWRPSLQGLL